MSNYYVSPTGNDSAAGTQAAPWLTLQKAANTVAPGDTVNVLAGNYVGFNLATSGTVGGRITFLAQPGAVINSPGTFGGIYFGVNASGPSYVTIEGFTIASQPADPIWKAGIRLSGIYPGGSTPDWALGNVIRNNVVQLRVVADGDVSHDYDQMPIFTSWQDGALVEGNTVSGGWDAGIYMSNSAKNYTVRGNTIFNVGGAGIHNNGDASQGPPGINVNGMIEANVIHDVGFGIGGQAISCDGLQDSVVRNNLIYRARAKGISLYATNAADASRNVQVVNNTVVMPSNATGSAFRMPGGGTGMTVKNNIFLTKNTNTGVDGGCSYAVDAEVPGTFDNNLITDPVQRQISLAQWRSFGYDVNGMTASTATLPLVFVDPAADDYHLASGSPAIDSGTSASAPPGDLAGVTRPQGAGFDVGAYESTTGAPAAVAFNKFDAFVRDLGLGVHHLGSDTLKVMLTSVAPVATNAVRADLTEIAPGSGYAAGGAVLGTPTWALAGAVARLTATDVPFIASGGSMAGFRYSVLYNDTPTSPADPLIGWWDFNQTFTLAPGQSFLVDFDSVAGILAIG